MVMRRTLREVAEIMINNGIELDKVKEVLFDLGFPKERVEEVLSKYAPIAPQKRSLTEVKDSSETEKMIDNIAIQEELKRQRRELEKMEQDLMKVITDISNLSRKVKALSELKSERHLEEKIEALEAKLYGFIDAILDNAPQLMESLKKRGLYP